MLIHTQRIAWRCDGCQAELVIAEVEHNDDQEPLRPRDDPPIGWSRYRKPDGTRMDFCQHHSWSEMHDLIFGKDGE